ncbi:uncharacterized protein VTP21DRAFT_6001 [Calcarisporiella thermophila]|uniref:uncharacterized protein n=1 Tax=Calcarisporiella thermophila TaxID=911321 RepID=UPI003741F4D6
MKIQGNTFAVTGATRGLGEATARILVANGANVILMGRSQERGSNLERELGSRSFWPGPTDIKSEENVNSSLEKGISKFGSFRGVVHCAGIPANGRKLVEDDGTTLDMEYIRENIETNLMGTIIICRIAASKLVGVEPDEEGERGVLITTSSITAEDNLIGTLPYTASKAAINALTQVLAKELADKCVRVMTISPGTFETGMLSEKDPVIFPYMQQFLRFPYRYGRPSEFAKLVLHVIENRYLNGTNIRIDGAQRLTG